MRRGDIVTESLDPAMGSEASKSRPAVIVSNDAANATAASREGQLGLVIAESGHQLGQADNQLTVAEPRHLRV